MMKRFRELNISIAKENFEHFISKVTKNLPQEWSRDQEREAEAPSFSGVNMYCFNRCQKDGLDSKLWITERDDGNLYISNIVPSEINQLKTDDYNKVLLEFYNHGIKELVENLGGSVELTSDIYSIEDLIGNDSARCLRVFSSSANKSTGSTHPCDRKRWFEFITLMHKSEKNISPEEVQKFLIEDGWTEDFSFELACEFEYSLNLLEYYEEK
ncbi:TPA: hypothetical protein ACUAK4_004230 [Escherichia coli]